MFSETYFSGDRKSTGKALDLLSNQLPADTIVYVKEELPVPYFPEFKESGYMMALIRKLYGPVELNVKHVDEQLIFQINGPNNLVFEISSLIKFLTTLPDKKFGMLLKLHAKLTNSAELIEGLIKSAEALTKTKVICLDCTKTEECKYLFVPGLCGTENQYKLQKHLNVLVEKLDMTKDEPAVLVVAAPPPPSPASRTYNNETLLVIRENCSNPHPALLDQRSVSNRLISTIRNS